MSRRWVLSGVIAALITSGCANNGYIPSYRKDYAISILRHSRYLHVLSPQVRAISMRPPFSCDAQTIRLARAGFEIPEDIDELERFAKYDGAIYGGPFAVRTVFGPDLEPGPWLYVLAGEERDDPATSLVNIVNRYNDVAKCLRRQP